MLGILAVGRELCVREGAVVLIFRFIAVFTGRIGWGGIVVVPAVPTVPVGGVVLLAEAVMALLASAALFALAANFLAARSAARRMVRSDI